MRLLAARANQRRNHCQSRSFQSDPSKSENLKPEQQTTHGSATIGGTVVNYEANAGTIVVHPKGWDDLPQNHEGGKDTSPECAMSYFAYFKSDTKGAPRPITFIYNGGPGSSTVWLHMGAFGPKRVVTPDDSHTPAAPYPFINNEYSLLDASDLVFVDAPGTGFSRLAGKDQEKAFFGVDADGQAFADFITQFLGKYSRWNSPKYVFGESYGTTRSAVLANILETEKNVDFNGIILLSQILSFDNSADIPEFNPGMDMPYQLALPTYAATAWYHHKLPSEHDRPRTFPHRGRTLRLKRIRPGPRTRLRAPYRPTQSHHRQAPRIHRASRVLSRQSQPAHQRRRI